MTLAIYPNNVRGLQWPVMKSHEFSTIVSEAPNFYTTRVSNSYNPKWHFTLTYEYLKDNPQDLVAALAPYTDYRYLEGFLLNKSGQFAELLFDDLYDDFIGLNPQPGGGISSTPSAFKVSQYPNFEFFYPLGSYIVDNNSPPHVQQVVQAGASGTTVPAFSTSGGLTTTGGAIFHDLGVFNGANAQAVQVVADTSGAITAATVGTGGTGFVPGDQLAVTGGGGEGAILEVATVISPGTIVTFTVLQGGQGYATTSGASLLILTGAGSGSPTANVVVGPAQYSPIQRNFGGQFLEDITDLNTTVYSLNVWDNGVLKTSGVDYTLAGPGLAIPGYSFEGLYLSWINPPAGTVTIMAQFYFRVRVESDTQDIEQFMQQLWTVGGSASKNGSGMIKLVTSRAA
jgi:hypothetical protein